jgi:integrase
MAGACIWRFRRPEGGYGAWSFDLAGKRNAHIVPLARQAVAIFEELRAVTGRFPYAFPNVRSRFRPMSDGALICALRRMGYTSEEMTAHGFRSVASTFLNEQGWNFDAIERQLAPMSAST